MYIDFQQLEATKIYHWMTQTIIPRPIAWALTRNEDGGMNLAPFSYFTAISSAPPTIAISIGKKPSGELKDTRSNLQVGAPCTVHIAGREMAQAVTDSSRTLPYGESELPGLNLSLVDFEGFELGRLAECRLAFGCRVQEVVELGSVPQAMVLLNIEKLFVDDSVMTTDAKGRHKVDAMQVNPLSRLGADEYATLGEVISIPRPA
ncbi:flavin reductase family protein [Hahella aquimaris]|uniref:flavin reductase family protein n=1 Tax=unclassified Hahella TaxID=2624107 RepID=UPI0024412F6D|nr:MULTISPECIES: flavin reductase family protein [unclassified Hahella]MDG9671900.1 flavin reductase family protein [Hahella sp. CR1]WLQ17393.1 flavin reductase family protein [Hahella sp. HNIBRBA332]